MTLKSVTTGIAALTGIFAVTSPTHAQLSNEVRRACEAKADQVRPALRTPEREQYIANCLADATASSNNKKN
jgi:hypothetical protein